MYFTKIKRNQNDGIIVFIRNTLTIVNSFEYGFVEANFLKLSLTSNSCKTPFNLLCTYRPPSLNSNVFLFRLNNIIISDPTFNDRTLLVGDMNINIIGKYNVDNEYLDMLATNGFHSLINVYTRLPNNKTHSCIDHMFLKCNNSYLLDNAEAGVLQFDISDHFPTITAIPLNNNLHSTIDTVKLIDYKLLNDKLKDEKWESVLNENNINMTLSIFYDKLLFIINECTFNKKIVSKDKRLKEWMTAGLLYSSRQKNELSLNSKNNPSNKNLLNNYKKYRNKFNTIVKLAKFNFYKNKFNSCSNNPKSTWKLIKNITEGSNLKNKETINHLKVNDLIINAQIEPKKGADSFNEFFTSIGQKLQDNFSNTERIESNKPYETSFDVSFLSPVDSNEVIDLINGLKDDTAAGFDKISVKLLKNISVFISSPLAHIYNMSLSEGIFPTKFKLAIVKPLFKKGNKESMNNYRPISMTCNFSKLLEKIVKSRLISFLEKHHLLSKNQFEFRPGVGTVDAIYSVSRHIYKGLDRGDKTIGIFLDFAKAFDTVDHKILLNILPNFGIKNNSHNWFLSYLKDRTQMVLLNDVLGNELVFNCGVPQGSVLSPILFIMYINSICDSQTNGSIFTYADDTCLLYSDTSWDAVYAKASNGLNQIIRKLNTIKITLNLDKSEFIAFSIYSCQSPFDETEITDNLHNHDGCKIKRVSRVRYLGLIFD